MQVGNTKKMRQWVVLGTGGTIAGTAASPGDLTGYTAAQLGVQALLESVHGLQEVLQGEPLHVEQVAQLNSKDMDAITWQRLARRCAHWLAQPEVGGLVVTHGTDTLEETAWFLQQVLAPGKPVVITCAMRPATAHMPDGPQNLLDAFAVVRDAQARGVLVVCAGRIHGAREVQKVHPYRLDAFDSAETGPLGWVEQGGVRWSRACPDGPAHPRAERALHGSSEAWPWVAIVPSHSGADSRQVQALVQAGVQGVVMAGSGNGTVHEALLSPLQKAQEQGVTVRLTTRCTLGQVVGDAAILPLAERGLNAYKARVSLMLDLLPQSQLPQ
ncbi:MAG: asparaginase [Limnohabitans sp.]